MAPSDMLRCSNSPDGGGVRSLRRSVGRALTGGTQRGFSVPKSNEKGAPMRAAVFHEAHQPMTIETLEVAKPGAHEVLLNTAYAGLCHSDLHFLEGLYPIQAPVVLGHESSAVVEAVGSEVTYVKPGDRVITCLSVFCGTCEYCTTGRPNLCSHAEVKMPPGQ